MFRASSLLSTSTTIHALWTPSQQPKSAWVKKCDPVSRSTLAARAHATTSDSCGTSMRNFGMPAVSCAAPEKSTRTTCALAGLVLKVAFLRSCAFDWSWQLHAVVFGIRGCGNEGARLREMKTNGVVKTKRYFVLRS